MTSSQSEKSVKSACSPTNNIFNIIAFKVFHAISEFVKGNMGPRRWKFDRIMLRGISKQQK